jgi:hypothetical protein
MASGKVRMYLYYSNSCGYCNMFTRVDGPWFKLTELINPSMVDVIEVDVGNSDNESEDLQYMDKRQGVPQLAVVVPEGEPQRVVGYTEQIEHIVNMIPTNCLKVQVTTVRGSARRRKSVCKRKRRSGRAPASGRASATGRKSRGPRRNSTRNVPSKRCFSPKFVPSIEAVLQHVLNHCNHKACKEKPSAAIACGRKCGCIE